jgi:hypothetical protein
MIASHGLDLVAMHGIQHGRRFLAPVYQIAHAEKPVTRWIEPVGSQFSI